MPATDTISRLELLVRARYALIVLDTVEPERTTRQSRTWRSGRWSAKGPGADEIFFVDLPVVETRKDILAIHLRRRKQDPRAFDLPALAGATEGFSGAEIEQVIVSGLYTAFASGSTLSTPLLRAEIARTRPLSRTMAERLTATVGIEARDN